MTDPVGSDALVNDLQALASRLNVKNTPGKQDSLLVDAAIEEIDRLRMGLFAAAQDLRVDAHKIGRLRAVIEHAPHGYTCAAINSTHVLLPDRPCDCWKAEVVL